MLLNDLSYKFKYKSFAVITIISVLYLYLAGVQPQTSTNLNRVLALLTEVRGLKPQEEQFSNYIN